MDWRLWAEFCQETQREYIWGLKFLSLFGDKIHGSSVLDVGCGTAEFSSVLCNTCKIKCIDSTDYRTNLTSDFEPCSFTDYCGPVPDIVLFKQSIHLISDVFEILHTKYKSSSIVVIQSSKPEWSDDPKWEESPLNILQNSKILSNCGRSSELISDSVTLSLPYESYKNYFLSGFTSDLYKMTYPQRLDLWNKFGHKYTSGVILDTLDILWASNYP